MNRYAQILNGIVVAISELSGAVESPDLIPLAENQGAELLGASWDGETFTPAVVEPRPYSSYSWPDFARRLQESNKGRAIRAEMRKASNLAYDLEQLFTICAAEGAVDFNDQFTFDTLQSLVGAGIITQAQFDNFAGVV